MTPERDEILRALLRERPQIMAYLWSFVRDVHDSEDLFQEVCIAVLNKSDQIKSIDQVQPWVRSAARLEALRTLRRKKTEASIFREDTLNLLDKAWAKEIEANHNDDLMDVLRTCLSKLTPYARRIIELRYKAGLTGDALAEAMDRKTATVYTALSRTHEALSKCIKQQQAASEGGRNA